MSRTSRKNTSTVTLDKKIYRAAAYIRLSVVKPNEINDSIENQKAIIEDYLSDKSDIVLQKFYIDENATGTSFERKGLQKMLEDIEQSKIDCVIVKDLSRFGRDAIEVGFYVQCLFPQKGIRFISILDRFDTIDGITDISFDKTSGLRIPLANIFNQEYVADIKRKTQASINANIMEGKYVAPRAPYGYVKSPDDCHQLVPDQQAVAVVKEIFAMAADDVSLSEIVRRLNLAKIPTPIDYAMANGLDGNYEYGDGFWNSRSVKYILTNRVYTGDLQQGKDEIVVENTHEALVSRELYIQIQNTCFRATATSPKAPIADNPLKGKVICASCGGKMQRRKGSSSAGWYFFSCITNNRKGSGCDTGMYIRESKIMDKIKSELARSGNANISKNDLEDFISNGLVDAVVHKSGQVDVHSGTQREAAQH